MNDANDRTERDMFSMLHFLHTQYKVCLQFTIKKEIHENTPYAFISFRGHKPQSVRVHIAQVVHSSLSLKRSTSHVQSANQGV